jgi:glutathione S-transferase
LSFSKQDFQDVVYTSPEKWFQEDKLHLGIDFPNLPYLINGPFKLSEAVAIQRYVINKWGNKELLGKNPHDEAQIDSFLSIF